MADQCFEGLGEWVFIHTKSRAKARPISEKNLRVQYIAPTPNFDTITDREIKFVQDWINSRPMKVLGYMTPAGAFLGICVPLAC